MQPKTLTWIVVGLLAAGGLRAQIGGPIERVRPAAPVEPGEACYRDALALSRDAYRCDLAIRVALDANDRRAAAAAYANRALILDHGGQAELARQDLLAALDMAPDDADLLAIQGSQLLRAGRLQEAAASFDRAVALRPDDPRTHYNRAFALRALGDVEAAAQAVARARALQEPAVTRPDSRAVRAGRAP